MAARSCSPSAPGTLIEAQPWTATGYAARIRASITANNPQNDTDPTTNHPVNDADTGSASHNRLEQP